MDALVKLPRAKLNRGKLPRLTGYPIFFDPGEFTLFGLRYDPAFLVTFLEMLQKKVLPVIPRCHHGVRPDQVDLVGFGFQDAVPKHWGMMIEVTYQIKGRSGAHRHVFHVMLNNGDQSGRLYTQTRRFIAK